jgi:hypothetical protein
MAEEGHPSGLQPVAAHRRGDECGEGSGLGADVLLVEGAGVEAAEPAVDPFLGRAPPHAEKRRPRRDPVGEGHQVNLAPTAAVQVHDHRAVGIVGR